MDTGILRQVWDLTIQATDPYMDGYYNFEKKKTLYMIQKIINSEMPKISTFVGEKEWLKSQGIDNGN